MGFWKRCCSREYYQLSGSIQEEQEEQLVFTLVGSSSAFPQIAIMGASVQKLVTSRSLVIWLVAWNLLLNYFQHTVDDSNYQALAVNWSYICHVRRVMES
jgi:hypothetical protein